MNISKETIIELLEDGEFFTTQERYCDCSVEAISNQTGVVLSGNECWRVTCLYVGSGVEGEDRELVAQRNDVTQDKEFWFGLTWVDLPADAQEDLVNDQPEHDPGDLEEIIKTYLEENELVVVMDPERGFANEYKLVLCSGSEAEELIAASDDLEILEVEDACERLDRYVTDNKDSWVGIAEFSDYRGLIESKKEESED
jgi:hypothetical protein